MPITLVGTLHSDTNGPQQLERVLEEEYPDIILAEGKHSDAQINSKMTSAIHKALQQDIGIQRDLLKWLIEDNLTWGFETRVAAKYVKKHPGCSLRFLGDKTRKNVYNIPGYIKQQTRLVIQSYLKMNEYPLQSLKQKKADADKRLMIQRDIIAKILNDPRYEFEQAVALGDVKGSRDAKMEKTLRNEHLNHPDKHILVITGMGHMYGNTDGKSMYSRITDLETRRIFLPAMERIESE